MEYSRANKVTMRTKASVTLQRKKLSERQGRNAAGIFKIREPRSSLPHKQDMSRFHPTHLCKAGVTCSWLCSASRLQGRKGQCPAILVPSPTPGALHTGLQPPPHQGSLSLSFPFLPPTQAIALPMPWILPSQPWSSAPEGAPSRSEMAVLPP